MKFWDSSALLPLLIKEATTPLINRHFKEGEAFVIWWGTEIECFGALARREREGSLTPDEHLEATTRLQEIVSDAIEVKPSQGVKKIAKHLLRLHPLRAANSLQLAAALFFAGEEISKLTMVTFDERLKRCSQLEGLQLAF